MSKLLRKRIRESQGETRARINVRINTTGRNQTSLWRMRETMRKKAVRADLSLKATLTDGAKSQNAQRKTLGTTTRSGGGAGSGAVAKRIVSKSSRKSQGGNKKKQLNVGKRNIDQGGDIVS